LGWRSITPPKIQVARGNRCVHGKGNQIRERIGLQALAAYSWRQRMQEDRQVERLDARKDGFEQRIVKNRGRRYWFPCKCRAPPGSLLTRLSSFDGDVGVEHRKSRQDHESVRVGLMRSNSAVVPRPGKLEGKFSIGQYTIGPVSESGMEVTPCASMSARRCLRSMNLVGNGPFE